MKYDLAIIGGGSAGLSIAAAAAQFGERVVLFEKGEMGGDCLNFGCVPSKSLLAAAKAAHAQRSSAPFGIASVEPKINYAKVMARIENVIATIAPIDSQERFEKLGVTIIRAAAKFVESDKLEADGKTYSARKIVIATGSRAANPDINGLAEIPYFTNETIFKNRVRPKHLIIIGGGSIGLEMAQAHRRLGCAVTVLEQQHPLAKDDPELVAVVISTLRDEGVDIRVGMGITKIGKTKSGIRLVLDNGEVIAGSHVLVATGRVPNIENLNLSVAGIAFNNGGIIVDSGLRSRNRRVYAAGDVVGGLQFTHVASYHAGLIIRSALFKLRVKNRADIIPWVIYTDPELAHVGLNEMQARAIYGQRIKILHWPFAENDRAQTEGKTKGLIKIVVTKNGRILGASIVGSGAGELIAPWVLAISQKLKISAVAKLVLPYPTLSEAGKRAAISNFSSLPKNHMVRRLLGFLKLFG